MQKEKILNVKIHAISLEDAADLAIKWTGGEKQRHIVTPNPEILLAAQKNRKFQKILNNADLSIPDGTGILWASKRLHKKKGKIKQRVTGVDLMQEVCTKSKEGIFLLGAAPGVADDVKKKLNTSKIVGTHSGSPNKSEAEEIIKKIKKSNAKILFVAFGAPKQEIWISENLKKMPNVKLAVGVGGAFDFIAGKRKRAPKILQKMRLEWLFRLVQQPTRLKRIFNATIRFPIEVLKSKN